MNIMKNPSKNHVLRNPSREYIKNLSMQQRRTLAERIGISWEYLYQIGAGIKTPHRNLAILMEDKTVGRIRESDFDYEIKSKYDTRRQP